MNKKIDLKQATFYAFKIVFILLLAALGVIGKVVLAMIFGESKKDGVDSFGNLKPFEPTMGRFGFDEDGRNDFSNLGKK